MSSCNKIFIQFLKPAAFLCLMSIVLIGRAQPGPVVVTDSGSVRGSVITDTTEADSGISVFKGIPFAASPVAMNRWRDPQPVAAWAGIRDASDFGPRCVQHSTDPDPQLTFSSEDCLYLNVWTPSVDSSADLPVLVWVHAGKFTEGSGSDPVYDGSLFAGRGAVVVSFNYRLNSLGFLAHPDLSSEVPDQVSGNYALADALAALRWVNSNIDAFGGDPDNITVLGNGAGAELAAGMVGSPLAEGLFKRAVLQNAGYMGARISRTKPLEQIEGNGERISEIFNRHSLEKLRELNTREAFYFYPAGGTIVVDGNIVPDDLSSIYTGGQQNKVDLLLGYSDYTAENTAAFPPNYEQFALMAERFGNYKNDFLDIFPADSDEQAAASYLSSTVQEQAWHLRSMAALQRSLGQQAWVYHFEYKSDDIGLNYDPQLLFSTGNHPADQDWTETDQTLADAFIDYLLNFAKTGNPNGANLPEWPGYVDNTPGNVLILDRDIHTEDVVYPSEETLYFFDAAYKDFLQR